MLNQIYVAVQGGKYCLGVNSREEAMLAAYGDYSGIDGVGYPSILGDFFETHSGEYVWHETRVSYEPEDIEETIDFLEALLKLDVEILHVTEGRITYEYQVILQAALDDAKDWKERYNA